MKNCLLILCIVSWSQGSPGLIAGETEDKAEIIKVENALSQFLVANDTAGLEARFSPDWKMVGSDGALVTRPDLMKIIQSGKLKFTSYEATELDVRVFGDAAVVVGRGRFSGTWDGEEFSSKDRFTDVFVRQDGSWRCVSSHSSSTQ